MLEPVRKFGCPLSVRTPDFRIECELAGEGAIFGPNSNPLELRDYPPSVFFRKGSPMTQACPSFGLPSFTWPSIGGLLIAMCISSPAAADGTILTCTNLEGTSFTGPGGTTKPGWSSITPETKYQLKLAITNQQWDIIRTNGSLRHSALADGCSVGMYMSTTSPLDMLFIVSCKDQIETVLFYTREGQERVITTTLSRELGTIGATVTETADCRKGD